MLSREKDTSNQLIWYFLTADISTIHLRQEDSSGNNISLFSFFVVATKRHMWKKGEGYANISSKKRLSCILSIKIKIHQMWIEHKTNMGAALWPCFFCPWNRSHNGNVHRNCQGDNSWSRNKIKTLRMQRSWKDCLHFFYSRRHTCITDQPYWAPTYETNLAKKFAREKDCLPKAQFP